MIRPCYNCENSDILIFMFDQSTRLPRHMTEYAGSRDYVGTPQSPPNLSLRVICRLHRSLFFNWDVWICVGSSAETVGRGIPRRNPEIRRTPSFEE